MTDGPHLFDEYMKRRGVKRADAAKALNTSVSAIHYWINGGQRPRADMREAIEKWSGGEVPADAWMSPEERARIDAVEPPSSERTPVPGKDKAS